MLSENPTKSALGNANLVLSDDDVLFNVVIFLSLDYRIGLNNHLLASSVFLGCILIEIRLS